MLDSTIHAKTLSRQIRLSDFEPGPLQIDRESKDDLIQRALEIASNGFGHISLKRNEIGGKAVYQHRRFEEALLTRHISDGVRRVTGVRQSDRQSIIRSIAALASEGVPFNVMKLDIKSFYETVATAEIVAAIRQDAAFSRQAGHLLMSLFDALEAQNITGLPRGLSLSATLAEYAMRAFDRAMDGLEGVRYYSRFVDDIIIVALDRVKTKELQSYAQKHLPPGLTFNRSKTKGYPFGPCTRVSTNRLEHVIEFLGYSLTISEAHRVDGVVRRCVALDISPKKVSRIKRRIARALLAYNNGGPFDDLRDRVKLLSSNFSFIDTSTGQKRFSGLRYNYSLINVNESCAIDSLDRVLVNSLISRHPNNRIRPSLTAEQRRRVLGLGFKSGFTNNRFFAFDNDDLTRITRCWAHA